MGETVEEFGFLKKRVRLEVVKALNEVVKVGGHDLGPKMLCLEALENCSTCLWFGVFEDCRSTSAETWFLLTGNLSVLPHQEKRNGKIFCDRGRQSR